MYKVPRGDIVACGTLGFVLGRMDVVNHKYPLLFACFLKRKEIESSKEKKGKIQQNKRGKKKRQQLYFVHTKAVLISCRRMLEE